MKRNDTAGTTPRDWVRGGAFPWPGPDELAPGDTFSGCYAVFGFDSVRTVSGETLVRLSLGEARGSLEGWAPAVSMAGVDWLREGAYVGVRGEVHPTATGLAAQIREIVPLHVGLEELALFLPSSPRDPAAMEQDLTTLMASVRDPAFAALLDRMLGPGSETGQGFRLAPAATRHHHAYLGGLLEHTLSVARLCDAMAAHYGPAIDRDLLITAALLHDVGKVREIGAQAGFPYTEEGRLLGHILLGLAMVGDAARSVPELAPDRRLLLEHLIASHQGRYEWQSPREPRVAEAFVLHYADDLDAKLNRSRAPAEPQAAGPPGPSPRAPANGGSAGERRPIRDDDTLDMFA